MMTKCSLCALFVPMLFVSLSQAAHGLLTLGHGKATEIWYDAAAEMRVTRARKMSMILRHGKDNHNVDDFGGEGEMRIADARKISMTLRKGMQNDAVAGDMHSGDNVDDAAGDMGAVRIRRVSLMAPDDKVDGCHGETYGSHISSLQHSFKEEWDKDLAAVLENATGTPMMVLSTNHELCIVDNFISNTDEAAPDSTIVIAALDVESNDFCVARRSTMKNAELRCLDFSSWIAGLHSGPSGILNGNAGFESCIWVKVVLAKPVLLSHAIQASPHGLLMMDADIVLHGNLPRYLVEHKANATLIEAGTEEGDGPVNSGSIWADSGSIELVRRWISECRKADLISSGKFGDQGCLADLVRNTHDRDDKWLQIIPLDVIAQGGKKGGILATHYNDGLKIANMRRDRVWKPSLDACK